LVLEYSPFLEPRIVHLITTIMRGGAENQLLILAAEQVKSGWQVDVIYLKGESELMREFTELGASVHSQFANMSPPLQAHKIRKFLHSPDFRNAVIHGHLPRAQIVASLSLSKSQSLICSRHDEDQFYPDRNRYISKLFFKMINSRVQSWIAISEAVKNRMNYFGEISSRNEVRVVHYGYGSKILKPDPEVVENLKSQYALNDSSFVIGCVARLVWQKDHATLIHAFGLFQKNNPDSKLILVGDGPMRFQLENLSKTMSLENSVIFTGKVSSVQEHLSLLDVFILPSRTEGFGLVLLEAMHIGVPIISSNASALPEVLGDAGLLFAVGEPADLLEKLTMMQDQKVQSNYSKLGKKRLAEFSPEIMWSKVNDIYEKAALLK